MPIILTTILPGVGHFYCGAWLRGAYYLLHSSVLLGSVVVCIVKAISSAATGALSVRYLIIVLALGAYGIFYTGIAVMDIQCVTAEPRGKTNWLLLILNAEILVVAALTTGIVILTGR